MSSMIDAINAGALALRDVNMTYCNLPKEIASPFILSKTSPYYGFVDVQVGDCPKFVMFSNNDDYVAKNYFWYGCDAYEPMSLKLWAALAKNSAVTLDVGSYTGVYSLVAASQNRKGKVHSFEALDMVYSRLLVNRGANRFGNMDVYHMAVSDREGFAEFNVFAGDGVLSTGSSLIEKQSGRPVFQKKKVRSARLDDLVNELSISRVDLMKIDAEGAEHLIFKGGVEMIKKYRPDIICEFLKGAKTAEIDAYLAGLGYRYFRIDEHAMSVDVVDKIFIGENMDTLNTLITCKTPDQIRQRIWGN